MKVWDKLLEHMVKLHYNCMYDSEKEVIARYKL